MRDGGVDPSGLVLEKAPSPLLLGYPLSLQLAKVLKH